MSNPRSPLHFSLSPLHICPQVDVPFGGLCDTHMLTCCSHPHAARINTLPMLKGMACKFWMQINTHCGPAQPVAT